MWIQNYLQNRKQYVTIKNKVSPQEKIKCGVPQGSILGPLLFLVYINDLHRRCVHTEAYHFADDTTIVDFTNSADHKQLEEDLERISLWLTENKLTLNHKKTTLVTFGKNKTERCLLNGEHIEQSQEVKYLGITLDRNLSYKTHIKDVVRKVAIHSRTVSRMRHYAPKHILHKYYNHYVKPVIEYGIIAYGCAATTTLNRIATLQRKIIRLIYNKKRRDNLEPFIIKSKMLDINQLHTAEVYKLLLKTRMKCSSSDTLNTILKTNEQPRYRTRRVAKGFLECPKQRTKFMRCSLRRRTTKLHNLLIDTEYLPENYTEKNIKRLARKFKNNYLLYGNEVCHAMLS